MEPTRFGRLDDWLRWLVGGLVAGLIAYGSVGARLATLETMVQMQGDRSREDRQTLRESVDRLEGEVNALRTELRDQERRVVIPPQTPQRFDK